MAGKMLKSGMARDLVPPIAGGVLAAASSAGIRLMVKPAESQLQAKLYQWAPLVGGGVMAGLSGLIMYFLAGKGPATAAALTSLLVGGSQMVGERLLASDVEAAVAQSSLPAGGDTVAQTGAAGLRGVVPRFSSQNGLNAIVWNQVSGNDQGQGADVSLAGTLDTSAFGTRPFFGG